MSQPDDESRRAFERLDKGLEAFTSDRSIRRAAGDAERGVGEGYRLMAEVIGGVLGGLGLGWVVDRFAHTTPFGVLIGLLAGTAASAYAAVKSADPAKRAGSRRGGEPAPPAADEEED